METRPSGREVGYVFELRAGRTRDFEDRGVFEERGWRVSAEPVSYFGETVPDGYVNQPAAYTQKAFDVKGAGIVAVIDTGIDPNHPALKNSLVPGYDFTRNEDGEGDETSDITLSSPPTLGNPTWVNQQDAAGLDQSTAAVVDGNPQYSDFGCGTMVSGIIHLVAPGASLMPLKAFQADGTGYNSDIIRAIYFAAFHKRQHHQHEFQSGGLFPRGKRRMIPKAAFNAVTTFAKEKEGQDLVEYSLLVSFLALALDCAVVGYWNDYQGNLDDC